MGSISSKGSVNGRLLNPRQIVYVIPAFSHPLWVKTQREKKRKRKIFFRWARGTFLDKTEVLTGEIFCS